MCSKKALYHSFQLLIYQVRKDAILILLFLAPLLYGLMLRYGIPVIIKIVYEKFQYELDLTPYYLLFDILLSALTPFIYCFAAAFIILGEIDDGITKYLAATPLRKKGYLISRLGFPMFLSFIVTIVLMKIFSLSGLSIPLLLKISILTSIMGFIEALMVVSISNNKVEGMAISKLSGLILMGLPVPFFIQGGVQYVLSFLPSFWIGKYVFEEKPLFWLMAMFVSMLWINILYRIFSRKII